MINWSKKNRTNVEARRGQQHGVRDEAWEDNPTAPTRASRSREASMVAKEGRRLGVRDQQDLASAVSTAGHVSGIVRVLPSLHRTAQRQGQTNQKKKQKETKKQRKSPKGDSIQKAGKM